MPCDSSILRRNRVALCHRWAVSRRKSPGCWCLLATLFKYIQIFSWNDSDCMWPSDGLMQTCCVKVTGWTQIKATWSAGRLAHQLKLYLDIDLRHWMCHIQRAGCCRNITQEKTTGFATNRVCFHSKSANAHKAQLFWISKSTFFYFSDVHWQNCGNSSMSHVCCSGAPWGSRHYFFVVLSFRLWNYLQWFVSTVWLESIEMARW